MKKQLVKLIDSYRIARQDFNILRYQKIREIKFETTRDEVIFDYYFNWHAGDSLDNQYSKSILNDVELIKAEDNTFQKEIEVFTLLLSYLKKYEAGNP